MPRASIFIVILLLLGTAACGPAGPGRHRGGPYHYYQRPAPRPGPPRLNCERPPQPKAPGAFKRPGRGF